MRPAEESKPKAVHGNLEATINSINKHYKRTVIAKASEVKSINVRKMPTGIFAFDIESGGGVGYGRIILLHGAYSSGKTTFACEIVKAVQQKEHRNKAVYIDLEATFDKEWAKTLGVDVDKMYITQPDKAEEGLDMAYEVVKSGDCGVIVIDSFGAITTEAELETAIGEEAPMGLAARRCNKFIRQVTSALLTQDFTDEKNLNDCIVVILTQERAKIGDKWHPIELPGGKGKDFAATMIVELRRGELIAEKQEGFTKKDIVGHETHFKIWKNKLYTPNKSGVYDFYNRDSDLYKMRKGTIDNAKSIMVYGIESGLIGGSGTAFFKFENKTYHGKEALMDFFEKNPDKLEEIKKGVLALLTPKPDGVKIVPVDKKELKKRGKK